MERIFKWFTLGDRESVVRVNWFATNFLQDDYTIDEFTGIQRLMVVFLKYCSDLGVYAKRNYLQTFLATEGRKVIKKYGIRIDEIQNLSYTDPIQFETAFETISLSSLVTYDSYIQEDLTDRTFKVDMKAFMEVRKRQGTQKVFAETYPLTMSGDMDEILQATQDKLQRVQQIYDVSTLRALDFLANTDVNRSGKKMRLLYKTGIPAIDADAGGHYSGQIISLSGQPGGGKTRFSMIHSAYQAAVFYEQGVLIRSLELADYKIRNMLIAHHIVHMFKGNVKIPDKKINHDELTDEDRRYVEAARIDLFESGKYGKIVIDDSDLIIETYSSRLLNFLRLNRDIQVIDIDYAGRVKSKPLSKYDKPLATKADIIDELYTQSQDIVKLADVGIWIVNQFTKEGNEKAEAGKRLISGDIQGGQAVQRHSDYDLVITATEQQKLANIRMLQTPKVREAMGLSGVALNTDLSVSIFRQARSDATN